MFGALKPGFRSSAISKLVVNVISENFKPKTTAAASRGFLTTARLSCLCSDIDEICPPVSPSDSVSHAGTE